MEDEQIWLISTAAAHAQWALHAWSVLTGSAAPRRFSELLQTLGGGGGGSEEVVRLVEERQYALNSAAAAEYIRALLETKQLDKLAEGGAVQ